jgi:hypothetical protein
LLVAPGTTLTDEAVAGLMSAASATLADIVFGDERVATSSRSATVLRRLGPFSHATFLAMPDLGCALAVRLDLLRRCGLPETAVLSGGVLCELVAQAHTLSHVPTLLGERSLDDVLAARPSLQDMTRYVTGMNRRARIVETVGGTFDIRFEAGTWKVAIIVVAVEPARARIVYEEDDQQSMTCGLFRARCEINAKAWQAGATPSPGNRRNRVFVGESYGGAVNAAVRSAPDECNLLLIVQEGAHFRSIDAMERLAETALADGVGLVAPLILYPDDRIRHAGLSHGNGESYRYLARFDPLAASHRALASAPLHRLRPVIAAARHCIMLRRSVFDDLMGLDKHLEADAADLDLCLRMGAMNLDVLIDGRVEMTGADAVPRWERSLSSGALRTLSDRFGDPRGAVDPNWVPDDHAVGGTIRTSFMPPLSAR